MEEPIRRLPEELQERARQAEPLAADLVVERAFEALIRDPEIVSADADAKAFVESHGVQVPEGLEFRFIHGPTGKPAPDYEFFSIRFTRCRRYWLKKRRGEGYEQVEICLGFEIVPHPLPPIA